MKTDEIWEPGFSPFLVVFSQDKIYCIINFYKKTFYTPCWWFYLHNILNGNLRKFIGFLIHSFISLVTIYTCYMTWCDIKVKKVFICHDRVFFKLIRPFRSIKSIGKAIYDWLSFLWKVYLFTCHTTKFQISPFMQVNIRNFVLGRVQNKE